MLPPAVARLLWRVLALAALALGLVGVVLPGLPTVPFLLLSAWAGGRGWPAFERWLLDHARLGPPVRRWRERGAVPRRAKWWASATMALSAALLIASSLPVWLKWLLPAGMAIVAAWLWRRPEA